MVEKIRDVQPGLDPTLWVEEHGSALFRFAIFRVHQKSVAEDLVQETFLAALTAKERFSGETAPRNWLYGILKHKIVDYYRKVGRENPIEDLEIARKNNSQNPFNGRGHWIKGPAEWKISPAMLLEQSEFHEKIYKCLHRMPKKMALVFSMREIDGMAGDEVCKLMQITPANYWVLLHRARLQLRSCIESSWLNDTQK